MKDTISYYDALRDMEESIASVKKPKQFKINIERLIDNFYNSLVNEDVIK